MFYLAPVLGMLQIRPGWESSSRKLAPRLLPHWEAPWSSGSPDHCPVRLFPVVTCLHPAASVGAGRRARVEPRYRLPQFTATFDRVCVVGLSVHDGLSSLPPCPLLTCSLQVVSESLPCIEHRLVIRQTASLLSKGALHPAL